MGINVKQRGDRAADERRGEPHLEVVVAQRPRVADRQPSDRIRVHVGDRHAGSAYSGESNRVCK